MNVVVTGATGFIGRHLVRVLLQRGDRVIAASRSGGSIEGLPVHAVDVVDSGVRALVERGDVVVHLAALSDPTPSLAEPVRYSQVNAVGTLNVLEAARTSRKRLIFASTQRIYAPSPHPVDEDAPKSPGEPYAWSKLIAESWVEMYARCFDLPATTLRFFSVYGPGQPLAGGLSGVVTIFLSTALAGQELRADARAARDFTDVGDVVRGILAALDRPSPPSQVYNIASGEGATMLELANLAVEVTGSQSKVIAVDEGEGRQHLANISRAVRELDFAPRVSLRQGLEQYATWIRTHGPDLVKGSADQRTARR